MLRFRRLVGSSADFPHMIGLIAPKRPSDAFYRSGGTGVWENTTQLLQYHGVDTAKNHNTFRNILNYDVPRALLSTSTIEGIPAISENRRNCRCPTRDNIDIGKAVGRNARLLSRPPEVVSARLASLKALGIDAKKTIDAYPTVLNLLSQTVQEKLCFLSSLGFDANVLVFRSPGILTKSKQAIRICIAFLEDSGLDAMRIVNAQPSVLGYNIDRKVRPTIEFITKDMGRSVEEINRCPRCLAASLEQRLKPRYRYMMLHGKRNDLSLRTLAASIDELFVLVVSDQPLEHYRQWRATQPV